MRIRRIILAALLLSFALAWTAWNGAANSAGAPENASKNGCTPCHGSQPGALATIRLTGVPDKYAPGTTYELVMSVAAPSPGVANQGGFAVSADAGTFNATDDLTQVRDGMVTHTPGGNDQRSWTFTWTAPTNGTATVTFFFAGNAVNGDAVAEPADQWAKGTTTSTLGADATQPTSPAPPPAPAEQETPGFGIVGVLVAALVVLLSRARRT